MIHSKRKFQLDPMRCSYYLVNALKEKNVKIKCILIGDIRVKKKEK